MMGSCPHHRRQPRQLRPRELGARRRWPIAVGLLGAAFVAVVSPDRDTHVIALLVALGCYLAAAALGARWVAWAAIPVGSALVVAGGLIGIDPWLVLGGASVVLVVLGLMLGRHARISLPNQWRWSRTGE